MSDTVKCDRCGGDTGKPCIGGKKPVDASVPTDIEVDTADGKKSITWRKHLHLCLDCINSLKAWFERREPARGHVECSKCHKVCVLGGDGKAREAELLSLPAVCEACL